ncbi:MAG: carboxypeptidase-like regulatory domain-containing protein, partial [Byssovorax sp.]
DQTGCAVGQACEEVEGAMDPACFAPVSLQGHVIGALDSKPIAGARVVASDADGAAVSTVAISGADGAYSLTVPAKRDAKGAPVQVSYTLRADAKGFLTFPLAPRVALPIDIATAAGTPPVLKSAATEIALIPLATTTGLGSVTGKVVADRPGGTLVVAGGSTGIADFSGNYEVFNVAAGATVAVNGYAAGLQITPTTAAIVADKQTMGIDLKSSGAATATVSGKVDIVNGGGATSTSVVLAVEETFNADAARGVVPKGLRIGNVTGEFVIKDVPDGKYVVLAAFENDDLVRDPDLAIGGTQIAHIIVAGQTQAIGTSFKVTGALAVVSPGATKLDEVSGTPKLVWADDSGEDHYEVRVFDALGNKTWENLAIPGVSGGAEVTVDYGGPALKAGMIYQFRATSIKNGGSPISQTEDLKGVFVYK